MTATEPATMPSNYIGGEFLPLTGNNLISTNPAEPESVLWRGSPKAEHVDHAIEAARTALPRWASLSLDDRIGFLRRWQEVTATHAERIAGCITDEMGKTLAESRIEANALGAKVDVTRGEHSLSRIAEYSVDVSATKSGHCRFKPHGVMSVIGPFNFPAHLPNGHFVPALLVGNTVVFKPSEKTPAVGRLIAELMHEAGLPPGVFNVVQGGGDIAAKIVDHEQIDGIGFTGSWPVGRKILEANLDRPGRIIALEMGGNNPSVVINSANLKQAVVECARASFATTGQRCTCTRRIIVEENIAEQFIPAFCRMASTLVIGPGRSDSPVFMGPVINEQAADGVLKFQQSLVDSGGQLLVEATRLDRPGHYVTPGVAEVDGFSLDRDEEVFGPFVQITTVKNLEEAIEQANATRFGLAASIFTSDDQAYERFFAGCRSGCINRNTGTAGASSKLPFGGVGHSGNHRPAAAFALDYCAYPVANMVETDDEVTVPTGMLWDDSHE